MPQRPLTALREAWTATRGPSLHRVRCLWVWGSLAVITPSVTPVIRNRFAVSVLFHHRVLSAAFCFRVNSGFRGGTGRQCTVFIKSTSRQFWWVDSVRFGDVDKEGGV